MKIMETRKNRTEMLLSFNSWSVRFWIYGPGRPQERRQIAQAISESVSKVYGKLRVTGWISHPGGYRANIARDEERPIPMNRALKFETEAEILGSEIRMRRLKIGWSQRELARRSGVAYPQISKLERGLCRMRESTFARVHWAFQDFEKGRVKENGLLDGAQEETLERAPLALDASIENQLLTNAKNEQAKGF